MRLATRSRPSICLPCRLRRDREIIAVNRTGPVFRVVRTLSFQTRFPVDFSSSSSSLEDGPLQIHAPSLKHDCDAAQKENPSAWGPVHSTRKSPSGEYARSHLSSPRRTNQFDSISAGPENMKRGFALRRMHVSRSYATHGKPAIELSQAQRETLRVAHDLQQRLTKGLRSVPEIKENPSSIDGLPIDVILKALPQENNPPLAQKLIDTLETNYAGKTYKDVRTDLTTVIPYRQFAQRKVTAERAKEALTRLGILQKSKQSDDKVASTRSEKKLTTINTTPSNPPSLAAMVKPELKTRRLSSTESVTKPWKPLLPPSETGTGKDTKAQTLGAQELTLESLTDVQEQNLPQLSFDLSRVLFNPGVYQLQDPRSRVYNFDPYLEHIMPISEFNFDALNPYLTSSEDPELLRLAKANGKRYTGSSSSMTSALSHFHFLISHWRELHTDNFTRGFGEGMRSFTAINRSPAAIFLRYKDGVYAVDADKEYDEPNVLLSLGKSLEKLLTLEKDDFEKWRKTAAPSEESKLETSPELFSFSQQGRFLLRSQLDAWDPRLPGSGVFDLKTRAVAGVRMNMRDYEDGAGYQIKDRFGTWESYEREYFDMMRSTFLKYSLQARMGQMDGIFVAYHNVARIFGFQYVPMSEMDLVLHGQTDPCLGDQEFRLSLKLMEEVFNIATETFPQRSMRIHFETREPTAVDPKPHMQVFIEPMTEDEITSIHSRSKAQFDEFERKLLHGDETEAILELEANIDQATPRLTPDRQAAGHGGQQPAPNTETGANSSPQNDSTSNAANTQFLNDLLNTEPEQSQLPAVRELLGLRLTIQNKVNDRPVTRPEGISPAARWAIDYKLEKVGDDVARRMYTFCKSRRMAALKTIFNRGPDDYFLRSIQQINAQGAEWRRQQDELDSQRETVVLYGKH